MDFHYSGTMLCRAAVKTFLCSCDGLFGSLKFIGIWCVRTRSPFGIHMSTRPIVWSISSLFSGIRPCLYPSTICYHFGYNCFSLSSFLSPLYPLINLSSAALSLKQLQCFPSLPLASSSSFHLSALVFPQGSHLKWCFITTDHQTDLPRSLSLPQLTIYLTALSLFLYLILWPMISP